MRSIHLVSLIFFAACNNSNPTAEPATPADVMTANAPAESAFSNGDNSELVGEWELVGFIGDTNDNLQLDEEERKNLKKPSIKDYMTFNRDGSGYFTLAKMEGRYDAKPNDKGQKVLVWYDVANGRHRIGTLVFASKDELHIKEPGGNGLFLWKKV